MFDNLFKVVRRVQAWTARDEFCLSEGNLVSNSPGSSVQSIPLRDIKFWLCLPEMGFDVVIITTNDDKTVQWFDWRDDLLSILRTHCADRERSAYPG